MAKLTKEELIAKINEKLGDNSEVAIELMLDVTDSLDSVMSELEEMTKKYDELLQRYKDRFMNPEEVKEEVKEEVIEEDEPEVIDIKEI